ncbi:MAG: RNA polymerase sigma factor [Chitinophagaceae bacterium]
MPGLVPDKSVLKSVISQLQQGEESAFNRIYEWFSPGIYKSLLRLVKSEPLAKEILQDVFFKAWEKREFIDPEKPIQGWLYRIAENRVYDYYRELTRDKQKRSEFITSVLIYYYKSHPDSYSDKHNALLYQAIEDLSPQRRQIFKLCKLEGKSYKEVSRELGVSESTISDHLVKAMKSIRDFFDRNQSLLHQLLFYCLIASPDFF